MQNHCMLKSTTSGCFFYVRGKITTTIDFKDHNNDTVTFLNKLNFRQIINQFLERKPNLRFWNYVFLK